MTAPGPSDPHEFPAPGSAAPGAPPALKRALTPADGVVDTHDVVKKVESQPNTDSPGAADGTRFLVAAAMAGVAIGLEIAAVISRPRGR